MTTPTTPNTLGNLFAAPIHNAAPTSPATPSFAQTPAPAPDRAATGLPAPNSATFNPPSDPAPIKLDSISLDAVVGGALMQLRFSGQTPPTAIKPWILSLDPAAKIRDDFPAKNFGQSRDLKTARALVVTLKKYNDNLSLDFLCQTPEGDNLTASPYRNAAAKIVQALAALPNLTPANKAKIEQIQAATGNPTLPLVLTPEEQFGVKYWTKDGSHIAEEITPEAPAV